MEILGKTFKVEKEYLDFIVENEDLIKETKKATIKLADGFGSSTVSVDRKLENVSKGVLDVEKTELTVKVAINTTNIIDSHSDMHVKGLWDENLKQRGDKILHLQEHKRTFDAVISRGDSLKAYAKEYTWKELGYDLKGTTQALMFDSTISKTVNEFMFEQYSKGFVTEHSVGMQYVKMITCIDDEDYPVQKENWDKYAPLVANKDALEGRKVFWAVTEAKAIEGSAVLMGSNSFTPTVSIKEEPTEEELKNEAKLNAFKKWLG
tara:strand:+ start:1478 stop:2269 length:792 start_codon:yes stop_codon:yes gene_type:complete